MGQLNLSTEEINALLDILKNSTYISDAPSDGKLYGRQNNKWVQISNQ